MSIFNCETFLDMEGVRGSIPLAPTSSASPRARCNRSRNRLTKGNSRSFGAAPYSARKQRTQREHARRYIQISDAFRSLPVRAEGSA